MPDVMMEDGSGNENENKGAAPSAGGRRQGEQRPSLPNVAISNAVLSRAGADVSRQFALTKEAYVVMRDENA